MSQVAYQMATFVPKGQMRLRKAGLVMSCLFATPSGVPQGIHLGPLDLYTFVKDLGHRLKSLLLM